MNSAVVRFVEADGEAIDGDDFVNLELVKPRRT